MLKGFLGGKKSAVKFQYDIVIHHLMKLPKNGIVLFISWKRGRKFSGETQKAFVKDKTAVWEQEFPLKATLFRTESSKFKKKYMTLSFHEVIKEGNAKKGKIGELNINLADFATTTQNESTQTRTISVKLWNSSDAQFKITVKCRPMMKPTGGLLTVADDLTTDTTAQTDMSDEDDDEKENPFEKQRSSGSLFTSPMKPPLTPQKSDSAITPVAKRTSERKRPEEDAFKLMITTSPPVENDISDEGGKSTDKSEGDVPSLDLSDLSKGKPKSAKFKRLIAGQNRRQGSISVDDDHDPFLAAITAEDVKPKRTPRSRTSYSGGKEDDESEGAEDGEDERKEKKQMKSALSKLSKQEQELKLLYQKLAEQQRAETERTLIDATITSSAMNYYKSIPTSAPIIFRCLKHWESFDPNKKDLLQKVVIAFEHTIKRHENNNTVLSFWLSNILVLINLVQKEFPVSHVEDNVTQTGSKLGTPFMTVNIPEPPTSLTQINVGTAFNPLKLEEVASTQAQASSSAADDFAFESPVAQFKSDLRGLAHKVYAMILKNMYEELLPVVIPAMFVSPSYSKVNIYNLISLIAKYLKLMKDNNIFPDVVGKFFAQVYYFINCQVTKALTAPKGTLCTMGFAIQLKMSLTQLESWAEENEMTTEAKNQLNYLRQVSNIMIMNKTSLIDLGTRKEVCPDLSIAEIKQILTIYRPDEFDPDEVPSSVLKALPDENSNAGTKFIDPCIIFKPSFKCDIELPGWQKIEPPELLKSKPDFAFLHESQQALSQQ